MPRDRSSAAALAMISSSVSCIAGVMLPSTFRVTSAAASAAAPCEPGMSARSRYGGGLIRRRTSSRTLSRSNGIAAGHRRTAAAVELQIGSKLQHGEGLSSPA
jgi:hypothetical protein